jgi:hypothetical protein
MVSQKSLGLISEAMKLLGAGVGTKKLLSGLVSHILSKPGISKGGQTITVGYVDCLHARAYIHCHKKDEKPRGMTKQGSFVVKCTLKDVKNIVHVDGN